MAFALYSVLYTGANTFLEDEKKFILHCTHVGARGIIPVNFTYTKTSPQSRVEFDLRDGMAGPDSGTGGVLMRRTHPRTCAQKLRLELGLTQSERVHLRERI
jgi:hypothetical protein